MSENNFQGETEQSIVAALRQGRQKTLDRLYDAYAPVMMGVISRIVADQEVAEEVLKETFVAIWTRIGTYDTSKHRLLTWGLAIARGLALEAIKTDRYESILHAKKKLGSKPKDQLNKIENSDRGKEKTPDLCKLDSIERTALELIYLKGRSCAETAAEMSMTVEQLTAVLKKAFIHLKVGKPA
ncbi:sigma-70 family RNA polymerase sigma factor [uncultured Pontibacter sp.]|uniref:RNA polymerase sigma factor n=1 Tax=uncultured Pontibacter sp. TaxID=453356 RepID=UPI002614AA43|nr:sigma-70 family RNA polymerase sigma factor [uncultured Pontibacter sp.]